MHAPVVIQAALAHGDDLALGRALAHHAQQLVQVRGRPPGRHLKLAAARGVHPYRAVQSLWGGGGGGGGGPESGPIAAAARPRTVRACQGQRRARLCQAASCDDEPVHACTQREGGRAV